LGTGGILLRKIRATVADEPTGFVWIEDGKLAGSGYPASRGQLEWLAKSGIQSVLTLTEGPLPKDWTEGLQMEFAHISLRDHLAPDAASMEKGADFIKERLDMGRAVLVHCLAGEGRTGCVIAAYFIKYKGMNAEQALSFIRARKPAFVEHQQESAVAEFAKLQRSP
jgi:atypical dual specificity phosphatase